MSDYLALPHLRVQGANIYNAAFLMGGPPVLSAWFLAHALDRDLRWQVESLAFVLHSLTPLGQTCYGRFNPQLRRGAAFTFGSKGSDYSSKNAHALSLQPVACAHMEVSLVLGVQDLDAIEGLEDRLRRRRLAGGIITGLRTPDFFHDDLRPALEYIGSGYAVMDRQDLLAGLDADRRAEAFVATLGRRPVKEKPADWWLAAACLGYAAITPFAERVGAREGYRHAFAEPLVGLVQYVPLRCCLEEGAARTLWRPQWVGTDVFRIQQSPETGEE